MNCYMGVPLCKCVLLRGCSYHVWKNEVGLNGGHSEGHDVNPRPDPETG